MTPAFLSMIGGLGQVTYGDFFPLKYCLYYYEF